MLIIAERRVASGGTEKLLANYLLFITMSRKSTNFNGERESGSAFQKFPAFAKLLRLFIPLTLYLIPQSFSNACGPYDPGFRG